MTSQAQQQSPAASTLLECLAAQEQLAPRTKELTARSAAAKAALAQEMVASKQRYRQIGQNKFIVLKKNITKPKRNDEFMAVALSYWGKQTGKQISEQDVATFIELIAKGEAQLAEASWTVAVTGSKPVASLLD